MRGFVIAGNWKMNTDVESASALARDIVATISSVHLPETVRIVVCPPFTQLAAVAAHTTASTIGLGAQNVHFEENGAYTGEISADMLRKTGCTHVIIGHSERRQYFGETDETVNRKIVKAIEHGLTPIVCIGETLAEREQGAVHTVLSAQIAGAFRGLSRDDVARIILAYEPVWAIGTGRTATPAQAQEAHAFIRSLLAASMDAMLAEGMIIQYGGSMNADNAFELLSQPDVDGGLIGGASLKVAQFVSIVGAAIRAAG